MVEVVTGGELDGLGVELEGGGRGLNNDRWSGGWRGVRGDGGHRSGWPEAEDVVVAVKWRGRRKTHVPAAREGALQDPDGVRVLGGCGGRSSPSTHCFCKEKEMRLVNEQRVVMVAVVSR